MLQSIKISTQLKYCSRAASCLCILIIVCCFQPEAQCSKRIKIQRVRRSTTAKTAIKTFTADLFQKQISVRGNARSRNHQITLRTDAKPRALTNAVNQKPIPSLKKWESNMIQFGRKHCEYLKSQNLTFDERLAATYYDAEYIYYRIADYTNDSSWIECAQAAEKIYRDSYVLRINGGTPGYWNFAKGLAEDYIRTGDDRSKQAVDLLSKRAAFAADATNPNATKSANVSREVAYAIISYLCSEEVGEPRRNRLRMLINDSFIHIIQWFIVNKKINIKPFMVGLTAEALIDYYNQTKDIRVINGLVFTLDRMWDVAWIPERKAFLYETVGERSPASDLNLLIAHAYAWVYAKTGIERFLERADNIFQGGVEGAWLNNPKQFNQSYRTSFDYVRYRLNGATEH
jgi:hypothetical protein